jgi:hypothetical protein
MISRLVIAFRMHHKMNSTVQVHTGVLVLSDSSRAIVSALKSCGVRLAGDGDVSV